MLQENFHVIACGKQLVAYEKQLAKAPNSASQQALLHTAPDCCAKSDATQKHLPSLLQSDTTQCYNCSDMTNNTSNTADNGSCQTRLATLLLAVGAIHSRIFVCMAYSRFFPESSFREQDQ